MEGLSFKGGPSAFIIDVLMGHGPFLIRIHQYQVCFESGFYKATLFHSKKPGRSMAHLFHHLFDGYPALVDQFKHGGQGVLNHGSARRCLHIFALLLFDGMWCMVGGDHIQLIIQNSSQQGIAII